MALGKNITFKKTAEPQKSKKKKTSAGNKIEKKKLISKKITNEKRSTMPDNQITRFITEEIEKKKKSLRVLYKNQVEEMREKLVQLIVLKIGSSLFAIDIELVKEVVPFSQITKIPNSPDHVKGATVVRGQTVTAVDLRSKFGQKLETDFQFTVTLKNKNKVALLVADLPQALKVLGNKIDTDLDSLESVLLDETYIKGIIEAEDQLILYLDITGLIDGDKAIVIPNEIVEKGE